MAVSLHTKPSKFHLKVKAEARSRWSRLLARNPRLAGFTLIELLIVVAIVALLGVALMFGLQLQLARSRDARRKADLEKLRIVFENYYNDHNCYPPTDVFFNGGSAPDGALCGKPLPALQPYLDKVPCDPDTQVPYAYYSPNGKTICEGYRLYTKLEDSNDQGIPRVGCGKTGCGALTDVNYGIAIGANLYQSTTTVLVPTPTPTSPPAVPTGFNGSWVCSPNADPRINGGRPYCKSYSPVTGHGCGASFGTATICAQYCYPGSAIICSS